MSLLYFWVLFVDRVLKSTLKIIQVYISWYMRPPTRKQVKLQSTIFREKLCCWIHDYFSLKNSRARPPSPPRCPLSTSRFRALAMAIGHLTWLKFLSMTEWLQSVTVAWNYLRSCDRWSPAMIIIRWKREAKNSVYASSFSKVTFLLCEHFTKHTRWVFSHVYYCFSFLSSEPCSWYDPHHACHGSLSRPEAASPTVSPTSFAAASSSSRRQEPRFASHVISIARVRAKFWKNSETARCLGDFGRVGAVASAVAPWLDRVWGAQRVQISLFSFEWVVRVSWRFDCRFLAQQSEGFWRVVSLDLLSSGLETWTALLSFQVNGMCLCGAWDCCRDSEMSSSFSCPTDLPDQLQCILLLGSLCFWGLLLKVC